MSPIPECEGIAPDEWSGKALLARHEDGSDFADVIIIAANPNACVDGRSRLGKYEVGIVVLEVHNGNPNFGDTCLRWPKRRIFYHGETGLVSVYDHARKRRAVDEDLERSRKRAGKRKYRYVKRTRAAATEDSKTKKTSWESAGRVFDQPCCEQECTRKIGAPAVRTLRTELHLQTYQVKATKMLEVHRSMHKGAQGSKVVTVEGIDMCPQAWRIVHDVSMCTFQRYKAKAKAEVRGAPHGNSNTTKTRTATAQAIQTLRCLLEASADHMPHLTRTLHTGEKVGLKVLPAGTQWNHLLATVNEVNVKPSLVQWA